MRQWGRLFHDAVPQYSGPIIAVSAGDEIAMNSMLLTVINIDGEGNGSGLIKIPMMNNLKFGLKLEGIKVAKGGCIVAGKAALSGVSVQLLNDELRGKLQVAYAAYNKLIDGAIADAGAIAQTYNGIADLLKDVRAKAKAVVEKLQRGEKPSAKELRTLQDLAKTATNAKQKELDLLRKQAGADTSRYVAALGSWLTQQQKGIGCVGDLVAQAPAAKKGGPNQEWLFFVADCLPTELLEPEPVAPAPVLIAPVIAYALKKMAEAGTGALLDGIVQYGVYKYSTGLNWEDAWDKIEFDKSSMFFSGISSMVKNKALSVGIDAVGSVVGYVVETPAEAITMNQLLVELGKGAGMGLVANFGGDAVRAVSNKIGADKVTEGFIRFCKDLNIGKETSEKVAKMLDGVVDKKKFDDIWGRVFGRTRIARALSQIVPNGVIPLNSQTNNQFHRWFDELLPEELDLILGSRRLKAALEDRIRYTPSGQSGMHEWCMVCEIKTFKLWRISMSEIHRFRTRTNLLKWVVPNDVPTANIRGLQGGHGGIGATTFHNELQAMIQQSTSLTDFNTRLVQLITRWGINPNLLPPLI